MSDDQTKKVIIIGAGIIGASIGYHLAQAGAQVTILEKGEPGKGTTADSFAWINASRGKRPRHYYELNLQGIHEWRRLEQEIEEGLSVKWGGSLEWENDKAEAETVDQASKAHAQWGYPLEEIDNSKLIELEPNVKADDFEIAIYTDIEGHVDPVFATQTLLAHAQKMGATLYTNCELLEIGPWQNQSRRVKTTQGEFSSDTLVIAAGNHSPKIAAQAGIIIPLKDSPGVLVHSNPEPELINRIVLSPHGHMKQKPDGRIVLGASFEGGSGTDHSAAAGKSLLNHAAQSLPQLGSAEIEKVTLGWRVLPEDGLPIIGFAAEAPDVYITAMHSGITLAPLVGKLARAEIIEGTRLEQLSPYRLGRFKSAHLLADQQ